VTPRSLALLLGIMACGTSAGRLPQPVSDRITGVQLVATRTASVYEALRRLQPTMLQARGPSSILLSEGTGPSVWIDGIHVGDVNALRDLPNAEVVSIQHVPAWDAATRYGPGFLHGVLVVSTRP
jgi:hypothetical protein